MSRTASPSTGKPYGVEAVCSASSVPRSSFYTRLRQAPDMKRSWRNREARPQAEDLRRGAARPRQRGPGSSPFIGEGHRKVWARLRFGQGIAVAKKRVLASCVRTTCCRPTACRLSAERSRRRDHHERAQRHVGNRRRQGLHPARRLGLGVRGRRALELRVHGMPRIQEGRPLRRPRAGLHGSRAEFAAERGIARGITLRMDHGTVYTSDRFTTQVKAWGFTPSYAFVAQPETNGVAERFSPHAQGAGYLRPDFRHPGRSQASRRRVRRTLQRSVADREERISEPATGQSRSTREGGCMNQRPQSGVQGTGCGTTTIKLNVFFIVNPPLLLPSDQGLKSIRFAITPHFGRRIAMQSICETRQLQ